MRLLKKFIHPSLKNITTNNVQKLLSARAIILKENKILLLYTRRYDDYSLPGGKLNEGEDILAGLKRELSEETGAQNIRNITEFGLLEELRPSLTPNYDATHLSSYCYQCDIDSILGPTNLESYEVKNGMTPKWVNITDAIKHNEFTLANSAKKGFSVERELILLKLIKSELT